VNPLREPLQNTTSDMPQTSSAVPVRVSSAEKREYLRAHYLDHRGFEKLMEQELGQCRKTPGLARQVRGDDWIACLECGLLLKKLPQHLWADHRSLRSTQYRLKWGYNKNTPLAAVNVCKKLSEQKKRSGYVPPVETQFGRERGPSPLDGVRARREWGNSLESKQSRSTAMLTRPNDWVHPRDAEVSTWKLAQARLDGVEYADIARRHGLKPSNVQIRLRKIFPPGRPCLFWRGEALVRRHLWRLCEDWLAVSRKRLPTALANAETRRLTVSQAAALLDKSEQWVYEHTRARSKETIPVRRRNGQLLVSRLALRVLSRVANRQQSKRLVAIAKKEIAQQLGITCHELNRLMNAQDQEYPLRVRLADRVRVLWAGLKKQWRTQSALSTGGRPSALLPSEEADVRQIYRALKNELRTLRDWLKSEEVNPTYHKAGEWACQQRRTSSIRMLFFWNGLLRSLFKANSLRDRLQANWRPADVAIELLAPELGIKERTLRKRVQQVPAVQPLLQISTLNPGV
jgi:hypothetical protein